MSDYAVVSRRQAIKNGVAVSDVKRNDYVVDLAGYLPTEKLLKSYLMAGKNLVDYRNRQRGEMVVGDDPSLDPRNHADPVGRSADLTDVSVTLRRLEGLAQRALLDVPVEDTKGKEASASAPVLVDASAPADAKDVSAVS